MKLLLDQNLSHRLVDALQDVFSQTTHVRKVGMEAALDEVVWTFAREQGFTIVSKDNDFLHRAFLYGAPPKVVWLDVGNCSTRVIEELLRANASSIRAFEADDDVVLVILP